MNRKFPPALGFFLIGFSLMALGIILLIVTVVTNHSDGGKIVGKHVIHGQFITRRVPVYSRQCETEKIDGTKYHACSSPELLGLFPKKFWRPAKYTFKVNNVGYVNVSYNTFSEYSVNDFYPGG